MPHFHQCLRYAAAAFVLASINFALLTFVARSAGTPAPGSGALSRASRDSIESNTDAVLALPGVDGVEQTQIRYGYLVTVPDRQIIQRLEEERSSSGFPLSPLQKKLIYPYGTGPVNLPIGPKPPTPLTVEAQKVFHEQNTRFSIDRYSELQNGMSPNQKQQIWHLMTPAPVNRKFFDLIQSDYDGRAVKDQPMLVYQVRTYPRIKLIRAKLLGVELTQITESPLSFLLRWQESENVFSFDQIKKVMTGFSPLPHQVEFMRWL